MEDGARWVAVVVAVAMVAVPTVAAINGQRTHDRREDCRDRIDAKLAELAGRSPRTFADLRERLVDRCDDADPRHAVASCREAIRAWHRDAKELQGDHAREWQAFHNETRTQLHRLVDDGNVTVEQVRALHHERADAARELMQEHQREWHELAQDHPARDECQPPQLGSPDDHPAKPRPCPSDSPGNASSWCHDGRARSHPQARCLWADC